LNWIGRRVRAWKREEQMDVVGNRFGFQERADVGFRDAADMVVEFPADSVLYGGLAVLGGESDVREKLSERLRHGMAPFQGW
jgi:hypothetical protein